VIYLLTPKTKYYNRNLEIVGNDVLWDSIKDSLKTYDITIWDYENMNTDTLSFYFFTDETHLSYTGAKFFTKLIKNQLQKTDIDD